MAYPVVAVVNSLLDRAEKKQIHDMNPMKVQKLLYYAQAWHLKLTDKEPLVYEYFCRWTYGPVIPSLYHSLKKYGPNPVSNKIIELEEISDSSISYTTPYVSDNESIKLLDKIIDVYGRYSGSELSNLTHQKETAWYCGENGSMADGSPISFKDMVKEIS